MTRDELQAAIAVQAAALASQATAIAEGWMVGQQVAAAKRVRDNAETLLAWTQLLAEGQYEDAEKSS